MTFETFKNIIRNGEAKGEIKISEPLTDFDLAVQWAIGNIGERKGYPCDITADEIWQELYPLYEADVHGVTDFLNACTEYAEQTEPYEYEIKAVSKDRFYGAKAVVMYEPTNEEILKGLEQTDCAWK